MRLLLIVISIYFTNLFSLDVISDFQEEKSATQQTATDTIKAYFSVTSDMQYKPSAPYVESDSTFNGVGNYRIKGGQKVYITGCCVGNSLFEYAKEDDQLTLGFDKDYKLGLQYYFYNRSATAYERNRYIKFRTPAYDANTKSFLIRVKFDMKGSVSATVEPQE